MKIKACTSFDKKTKKRYFKEFEVFSVLPELHSIVNDDDLTLITCSVFHITIPSELNTYDVLLYDYFYVTFGYVNIHNSTIYDYFSDYICIKKEGV